MIYTVKFLSPFYVLPGAKNAKPWGKKIDIIISTLETILEILV